MRQGFAVGTTIRFFRSVVWIFLRCSLSSFLADRRRQRDPGRLIHFPATALNRIPQNKPFPVRVQFNLFEAIHVNVLPSPPLNLFYCVRTHHPPIHHNTNRSNMEPFTQSIHNRNQRLHIRRVPRPQLTTNRTPLILQHHPHNHLFPVRTMIFAIPILAYRLSAFPFKVNRGRIEKHDVQRGDHSLSGFAFVTIIINKLYILMLPNGFQTCKQTGRRSRK